jgi:hypothetical protein
VLVVAHRPVAERGDLPEQLVEGDLAKHQRFGQVEAPLVEGSGAVAAVQHREVHEGVAGRLEREECLEPVLVVVQPGVQWLTQLTGSPTEGLPPAHGVDPALLRRREARCGVVAVLVRRARVVA